MKSFLSNPPRMSFVRRACEKASLAWGKRNVYGGSNPVKLIGLLLTCYIGGVLSLMHVMARVVPHDTNGSAKSESALDKKSPRPAPLPDVVFDIEI
jgi:hypothetical protein